MSLRHAILGLLTFEPMSGYTLKTRYFDRSIAHFWPADQAQIYRTLQSVERDGLASCDTVASDSRPDSRVYSITEAGRRALHDWLAQAQKIPVQRDGILLQLYFGRLLSREQMLAVLEKQRSNHLRLKDYFDDLEIPEGVTEEMRRQVVFGKLTLDYARRRERMLVDWLEACISEVKVMVQSDSE